METIYLADDHPVTLTGIGNFVAGLGYKVLGTTTNGITALNQILTLEPDYAIVDMSMPGLTGLEVLEKVRAQNKKVKLILYTMYNERALFEKAKSMEVNGYVLKDFALEELVACLEQLRYHKQWFSPRLQESLVLALKASPEERLESLTPAERKILSLIGQGKSTRQIADQLFIAEKTVENHRSSIIKKLRLPSGPNVLAMYAAQYHR